MSRRRRPCRPLHLNVEQIETCHALPAQELRRRIGDAISELINFDLWNRQTGVQDVELRCVAEIVGRIKSLGHREA